MISVRFERGRNVVKGPTYGPYTYVQVTAGVLRVGPTYEINTILAVLRTDGDWELVDKEEEETVFSDFIIF